MILWPCWLGLQITLERRFHNVVPTHPTTAEDLPTTESLPLPSPYEFRSPKYFFSSFLSPVSSYSPQFTLLIPHGSSQKIMYSNSPIICSPSTKTFTVWPIISKSDLHKNSAVQAILRYSSIHVTISDKQRMKESRRVIPFASLWLVKLLTTKRKTSGKMATVDILSFFKTLDVRLARKGNPYQKQTKDLHTASLAYLIFLNGLTLNWHALVEGNMYFKPVPRHL